MKCALCVCGWVDEGDEYITCHADPNWPAPCEYEEDIEDWED